MIDMLLHTLAWTGVLIVAVLLLRRPVTRHFGPEAAYALWALPLFRLILPPVTLPAWMAPQAAAPAVAAPVEALAAVPADAIMSHTVTQAPVAASVPQVVPMEAAPHAGFDLLATIADWPLVEGLLLLWIAGAAVSLWLRFAAYFSLRDELLANAREVGRAKGLFFRIRLVETPATTAPLAMGVLDPVIALPPGFMALHDRAARDLALAHELAHHRGGDLLVNVLVQPLFALHWFNPLGRFGWMALRRDQEAACDARVMARRQPHERAAYAALIARFAATPGAIHNAALTAPMACPVLGEKSIIHRLRSLTMSDLSPRRRMAGRALLGAGLLVLPLTASISYAATDSAAEAPEPPAPPAPPAAPDAPDAPPPPPPPHVMIVDTRNGTVTTDGDAQVTEQVWRDADGKEHRVKMVIRGGPDGPGGPGRPDREAMEKRFKALQSSDKAEREAAIAEMRAEMEARRARGDMVMMRREIDGPRPPMPPMPPMPPRVMVMQGCKPGSSEMVDTTETKDGTQKIMICQTRIADSARAGMREARSGLEEARAEIAGDKSIPEDTRKKVLETLDAQIARFSDKGK